MANDCCNVPRGYLETHFPEHVPGQQERVHYTVLKRRVLQAERQTGTRSLNAESNTKKNKWSPWWITRGLRAACRTGTGCSRWSPSVCSIQNFPHGISHLESITPKPWCPNFSFQQRLCSAVQQKRLVLIAEQLAQMPGFSPHLVVCVEFTRSLCEDPRCSRFPKMHRLLLILVYYCHRCREEIYFAWIPSKLCRPWIHYKLF